MKQKKNKNTKIKKKPLQKKKNLYYFINLGLKTTITIIQTTITAAT